MEIDPKTRRRRQALTSQGRRLRFAATCVVLKIARSPASKARTSTTRLADVGATCAEQPGLSITASTWLATGSSARSISSVSACATTTGKQASTRRLVAKTGRLPLGGIRPHEAVAQIAQGGDRVWLKPSASSPALEVCSAPYRDFPQPAPGRVGFGKNRVLGSSVSKTAGNNGL